MATLPLDIAAFAGLPVIPEGTVTHGEVFTRRWVVETILDLVDWRADRGGGRRPVRVADGVFAVDPIWRTHRSYPERFSVFCERILADGLYDAVCYAVSSPEKPTPVEPVPALDWQHFVAAIRARITYLAELGFPGR